jgi:hypothetical protein
MNRAFIVVIAFAVYHVAVPIKGQTPENDSGAYGQHGANTNAVNIDTVNVDKLNVRQQQESAKKSDRNGEKPPSYLHRLVEPEALPNTILCLVGIAGVFGAMFTLRAMKEQAGLMDRQVKVMEGQLEAQMESLRARLTIGFTENPFKRIVEGKMPLIIAKFINTGATPAYNVIPETWIEVTPIPFTDFTDKAVYFKGERLSVYPSQPLFYEIPLTRILTFEEAKSMSEVQCAVCVRIRLTYQTCGKPKYCDFAYRSLLNGMETLPKYRDAD